MATCPYDASVMRRFHLLVVPVAFALIAAACAEGSTGKNRSSDDDDGSGGAGGAIAGSGTGGSAAHVDPGCSAVCLNAASAGCPGFGVPSCLTECEGLRAESPTSCSSAMDGVLSCWSTATPLCGTDGVVFDGCTTAEDDFFACVTNAGTTTTSTTSSTTSSTTGGGSCGHSECIEGAALIASCSPCAAAICANDSYCCTTAWDSACVNAALIAPECSC